jgi:methylated-DNA-protein-cysteine methyltransferase-like protein
MAGAPHPLRPAFPRRSHACNGRKGWVSSRYNLLVPKPNPKTLQTAANIRAAIMQIPRGRVSSYGAIAAAAGLPRGARLVVRVLNQSHGLPWHRVVAAGGRIALPGEHGLDQRFRLEMEGVKFSGRKVRMAEFEFKFPKKRTSKPKKKSAKKKATKKKKKIVERSRPRLR